MTSVLSRLFTYAKATGAEAIENFTTEALAGAIRSDPAPFVRALASLDVTLRAPMLEVATQVTIDGGRLDLLLVPKEGRPVAVEVKVRAGPSGDQLPGYLAWAESFEGSKRPHVVILSVNPITNDTRLPWLKWQQVWKEIGSNSINPWWSDLKTWLEEQRMADDSFDPITDSEAASLRGAHALLRKATRILIEPSARMNRAWPTSNWPRDEKQVLRMLSKRFRTWPSYTVTHQSKHRCGCAMGIYHEATDDNAWLGIWMWAPPKRLSEREQIRSAAKSLPSHWEPDATSWELLGAYQRLLEPEAATRWFIARIAELEGAGMFRVLDSMRPGDPEDHETPG